MANYDNLPVYKSAYDLLLYVFQIGHNMQRDYRYTLGETLKKELVGILVLIYKANMVTGKSDIIAEARERIVVVKLHLRLLCDLKQISMKGYANGAQMAESVSKQLAAWQKSQKNANNTEKELLSQVKERKE